MIRLISLSASPVLYHLLHADTAISVLETNKFTLSASAGTNAELDLHREHYYMSMTRHNLGRYSVTGASANNVILNLNGTLLGQRYKIKPLDYWGESFRKAARGDYEAEDRLLSDKPTVPNASKYITSIRAMIGEDDGPSWKKRDSNANRRIRKLLLIAKKRNIPVRLYKDRQAFLIDDERKAVDWRSLNLKSPEKASYYNRKRTPDVFAYSELYERTNKNHLSENAQYVLSRLIRNPLPQAVSSFQNEIHNSRSSKDERIRNKVDSLISIMRIEKMNANQFIAYLQDKWRKL